MIFCYQGPSEGHAGLPQALVSGWQAGEYIHDTNDQPCSSQLYYNGSEVWYFTAWYNIAVAGEGIMTQHESIFLNLASGNTLEWYLLLGGSIIMTIGGGNYNSGKTMFNTIRIAQS